MTRNKDGNVLWGAYCPTCHQYTKEGEPAANGAFAEAAARIHIRQTGHEVIVGFTFDFSDVGGSTLDAHRRPEGSLPIS